MTGCQVGIALATFWILDLTSEKCGFASPAPKGLKDQHIHTWLSISVGPEHLVFEGQKMSSFLSRSYSHFTAVMPTLRKPEKRVGLARIADNWRPSTQTRENMF